MIQFNIDSLNISVTKNAYLSSEVSVLLVEGHLDNYEDNASGETIIPENKIVYATKLSSGNYILHIRNNNNFETLKFNKK